MHPGPRFVSTSLIAQQTLLREIFSTQVSTLLLHVSRFGSRAANGAETGVNVTIINDGDTEGGEDFSLQLTNVQNGAVGPMSLATVTITANDQPPVLFKVTHPLFPQVYSLQRNHAIFSWAFDAR